MVVAEPFDLSTSEIAAARLTDDRSFRRSVRTSGVGPAFVSKYAEDVLALVAEHASPLAA